MKKELVIKKCLKCGALIEIINDCNCEECGIMCCGEKMMEIKPNTIDASFEKHVPTYEKVEDEIIQEMKSLGKPFVIVLNTKNPTTDSVLKTVEELSLKYNESVYACNVAKIVLPLTKNTPVPP